VTATARLLVQRSVGCVHLRMERDGIAVMREAALANCYRTASRELRHWTATRPALTVT
jgi:hypothetical protein